MSVPCGFVPPIILSRIAAYAPTEEQRTRALQALLASMALRERRESLAPVPGEPNEGEVREIQDARNREVESGPVVRREDEPPGNDSEVNGLYDGTGNVYKYLYEVHGWKGMDGQGEKMICVARYGDKVDNAMWTGKVYVSGEGDFFNPFWKSLDVPGHEWHHCVNQFARDFGPYRGQPGCLMESTADFGGLMTVQYTYRQTAAEADWLIGAELCDGKVKRGSAHPERRAALRDTLYPGDAYDDPVLGHDDQPADMDGFSESADVHVGSSIPSRAFALASIQRGGYAWETIGEVWWDVMINRVPARPTFQDWAYLTMVSSDALFGSGSLESQAILAGWHAVKIDPTVQPAPTPSPSPCAPEYRALLHDPEAQAHLQHLAHHGFDAWRLARTIRRNPDLLPSLAALASLGSVKRLVARTFRRMP